MDNREEIRELQKTKLRVPSFSYTGENRVNGNGKDINKNLLRYITEGTKI